MLHQSEKDEIIRISQENKLKLTRNCESKTIRMSAKWHLDHIIQTFGMSRKFSTRFQLAKKLGAWKVCFLEKSALYAEF